MQLIGMLDSPFVRRVAIALRLLDPYNVTHKPFDQLEVRQALDMAVNKQAIIDAVYQGAGQLAVNGMPPTQWSYDETIKDAPFDPAKARELLKKAGVAEGRSRAGSEFELGRMLPLQAAIEESLHLAISAFLREDLDAALRLVARKKLLQRLEADASRERFRRLRDDRGAWVESGDEPELLGDQLAEALQRRRPLSRGEGQANAVGGQFGEALRRPQHAHRRADPRAVDHADRQAAFDGRFQRRRAGTADHRARLARSPPTAAATGPSPRARRCPTARWSTPRLPTRPATPVRRPASPWTPWHRPRQWSTRATAPRSAAPPSRAPP